MPVCLEPDQRFPVVLDIDKDKTAGERPTFHVVSLSMREQLRLSDGMDAALQHETTEQIFAATCELLNKYVVGWSHMTGFDYPCDVREFLTHGEARELLVKILANSHLKADEKKS